MALIRELARFERAPEEVTVSEAHFEESGFGERPVWWALVACAKDAATAEEAASEAIANTASVVQDPLLVRLSEGGAPAPATDLPLVENAAEGPAVNPVIQLEEAVIPIIPDQVTEAMPLMENAPACERVVGFALWYLRYSTWKGQRMYLEDIIVTESWRRRGVGTALMDGLVAAAAAGGLHGISWQVLNWNADAMKFYEKWGTRFDPQWVNAAIDI